MTLMARPTYEPYTYISTCSTPTRPAAARPMPKATTGTRACTMNVSSAPMMKDSRMEPAEMSRPARNQGCSDSGAADSLMSTRPKSRAATPNSIAPALAVVAPTEPGYDYAADADADEGGDADVHGDDEQDQADPHLRAQGDGIALPRRDQP